MSSRQIEYIDIAKGILIICLLYGHSFLYSKILGYNDDAATYLRKAIPIYNAFFMQSFFIITGFCSSFKLDFFPYL